MHFWQTKTLNELSTEEWESLCDGCGRCCLHKLEDEDTGQIAVTRVACRLLDLSSCRCSHYDQRLQLVPECMDLKRHDFSELPWLPDSCAYRLINNGLPLPDWHPLITGDKNSVKLSGASILDYAVSENDADDLEDYIIDWL